MLCYIPAISNYTRERATSSSSGRVDGKGTSTERVDVGDGNGTTSHFALFATSPQSQSRFAKPGPSPFELPFPSLPPSLVPSHSLITLHALSSKPFHQSVMKPVFAALLFAGVCLAQDSASLSASNTVPSASPSPTGSSISAASGTPTGSATGTASKSAVSKFPSEVINCYPNVFFTCLGIA